MKAPHMLLYNYIFKHHYYRNELIQFKKFFTVFILKIISIGKNSMSFNTIIKIKQINEITI